MSEDKEQTPLVRVSDLFGVAKPLQQLVSAIERGIGNIARPFQKRRETKADVAAYEAWADALERTGLTPRSAELTLAERAIVRVTAETIRKQDNRESIALEAVREHVSAIEHAPHLSTPDTDIEPEWLDRFWRLAQDVTDKDMQTVWGRILARQAQTPTKYSARCLEALSLLSRQEAIELERLSKFVCSSRINDSTHHFFLLNPGRMGNKRGTEAITQRISELVGDTLQSVFGPAGFYTHSGSGWAQSADVEVIEGSARLSIANIQFTIQYPNPTTSEGYIGSGLGISPLGAEIFSLIETEPDPTYVQLLSSALDAHELKLGREG